jgi:hypothetical protein
MILVPIFSITGYIVILSYANWTWIEADEVVPFIHSIVGFITILLSIVQVFIELQLNECNLIIFNFFQTGFTWCF